MCFCVGEDKERKEMHSIQLVLRIIAIAMTAFMRMSRGFFAFCAQLGEISLYNKFGRKRDNVVYGKPESVKDQMVARHFSLHFRCNAGAFCDEATLNLIRSKQEFLADKIFIVPFNKTFYISLFEKIEAVNLVS